MSYGVTQVQIQEYTVKCFPLYCIIDVHVFASLVLRGSIALRRVELCKEKVAPYLRNPLVKRKGLSTKATQNCNYYLNKLNASTHIIAFGLGTL